VGNEREKDIVYRPLYESPIISVHDYCCHIERSGPGAEEEPDANNIVLMRWRWSWGFRHSHFTDAFRREFGKAPSEIRKILEVDGAR